MNWTLEVVVVPITNIDVARAFYEDKLAFHVDHDTRVSNTVRIIQLTPPGSGCSIVLSKGVHDMEPGILKGLQLVVNDVRAAHAYLTERGVACSPVQYYGRDGTVRKAQDDDDLNNSGFVFFSDPDGNLWAVQEISSRD